MAVGFRLLSHYTRAMARVAIIDDYPEYAEMAARPLREAGHHLHIDTAPIDWEALVEFQPQVLVVGLSRAEGAIGRPIEVPERDILGYKALKETEMYPAIQVVPIVLAALGLLEREVPTAVPYDLFISLPKEARGYEPKLAELAEVVKTRRRISRYVCPRPACGSRLVYVKEPARDLFCPKCGAGVALIDDDCTWLDPSTGDSHRCKTVELLPPPRAAS